MCKYDILLFEEVVDFVGLGDCGDYALKGSEGSPPKYV
jgi:hypothetical protein